MDTPVPQQSDMFPDDVPDFAVHYWCAVRKWFETTRKEPIRDAFLKVYNRCVPPGESISMRTFDRERRVQERWVGTWPPRYGARPPWEIKLPGDDDRELYNVYPGIHEIRRVRVPVVDEDGQPAIRVDEYDSVTKRVIHSYVQLHGMVAALLAIPTVLDLWDGHLDGLIHLCRLVATRLALG